MSGERNTFFQSVYTLKNESAQHSLEECHRRTNFWFPKLNTCTETCTMIKTKGAGWDGCDYLTLLLCLSSIWLYLEARLIIHESLVQVVCFYLEDLKSIRLFSFM